jgi:anti-sigma B factor antagonist
MRVHITQEPRVVLATVEGRFDVHGMDQFNRVLDLVSDETPNVIIDLSAVEFMDSSALSGLVRTLKRTMTHQGSIVLANASSAARIILELTRLDEVFGRAESVAAARALISQTV